MPLAIVNDVAAAGGVAAKVFQVYRDLPEYRAMLDRGNAAEPVDVALVGDRATIKDAIKRLEDIGITDLCASSSARSPEPLSERSISWVPCERPRAPQPANLGSGRPFAPCPLL
jgi:5,10-methylenetetrahydromethanopterin reductase